MSSLKQLHYTLVKAISWMLQTASMCNPPNIDFDFGILPDIIPDLIADEVLDSSDADSNHSEANISDPEHPYTLNAADINLYIDNELFPVWVQGETHVSIKYAAYDGKNYCIPCAIRVCRRHLRSWVFENDSERADNIKLFFSSRGQCFSVSEKSIFKFLDKEQFYCFTCNYMPIFDYVCNCTDSSTRNLKCDYCTSKYWLASSDQDDDYSESHTFNSEVEEELILNFCSDEYRS